MTLDGMQKARLVSWNFLTKNKKQSLLTAAIIELALGQIQVKNGRYLVFKTVMVILRSASTTEIVLSCETQAKRLPSGENDTWCTQPPVQLDKVIN